MTTGESCPLLEESENNGSYVDRLLIEGTSQNQVELSISSLQAEQTSFTLSDNSMKPDSHKLNSAIWTTHATSSLLKVYEEKLEMLETPKKKTRIWIAVSDNLKDHSIYVTPDQVRWKINALTKKYKRCIEIGKHDKFKYFKEIDAIYGKYNVDCDSYSITEHLSKKRLNNEMTNDSSSAQSVPETRAIIEMRKARLARRIDCDRFQGKIKLDKQCLQYLHREEEHKKWRDKIFERSLKLREEKLETRKRELEVKESLELKKLQFIEKEQNDLIAIEQEKCELLKKIFNNGFLIS